MDNARLVSNLLNWNGGVENSFLNPGIFCHFPGESSWPRDLPQNLWKKWWLWVVVMGANTFNVHALFQLHRIWVSRHRTLSRMHQWAETVSRMFPYSIFFLKWAFLHSCPARECHGTHKCQGHIVDSKIVQSGHLEDCISFCGNSPLCEHYTLEKKHERRGTSTQVNGLQSFMSTSWNRSI